MSVFLGLIGLALLLFHMFYTPDTCQKCGKKLSGFAKSNGWRYCQSCFRKLSPRPPRRSYR